MSVIPYVVDSPADVVAADGVITLREALQAANTNAAVGDAQAGSSTESDVITFALPPGENTIALGGTQLEIADDLLLLGPGADRLTIDAAGQSRVFSVASGAEALLYGLRITGGSADSGGGIYNAGTLSIVNSTISGNAASGEWDDRFRGGGGIYNDPNGTLAIANSTISSNLVSDKYGVGGGILNDGTLVLTDSIVSGNSTSGYGGGIFSNGTLMVSDSTLSGNSANGPYGAGGAICAWTACTSTIMNSTFSGNFVNGGAAGGGAIVNVGTCTITESTFSGNWAVSSWGYGGGAIYNEGTLTLVDSTVSGNSATDGSGFGGGIESFQGTLIVINSTFLANSASRLGGGIDVRDGVATVTNSVFFGNSAEAGGGIYGSGELTVTNVTVSGNSAADHGGGIGAYGTWRLTNSIVALNQAPTDPDISGSIMLASGSNLIGVDPLFVNFKGPAEIGPGADGVWGTPDDILADLRLTDHSAAVDMGNNTAVPAGVTTDADGNPRVVGPRVDIGAYEFQGSAAPGRETPSTVVTSLADTIDLYDGVVSLREALFYIEQGGVDSTITFNASLDGGEIILGGTSLWVDRPVRIDASLLGSMSINGDTKSRVFTILPSEEVRLVGLTITGGSASSGGAVYNLGTLTLANSTLSDNRATSGGAIYNKGTMIISNSTLSDNVAYRGGAIYDQGILTVTNSTVAGNSGGGIYSISRGTLTLANSIVALNTGGSVLDVYGSLSPESASNLVGVWEGTTPPGLNSIWGTVAHPLDPGLSHWSQQSDGTWGYYLLAGSPAIDAGNNALAVDPEGNPLTVDLYGNPRIQNSTVDIGAVEGATPFTPGFTYIVESLDWSIIVDGVLTLGEALAAADSNQPAGDAPAGSSGETDRIEFAEGVLGTVFLHGKTLSIHGNLQMTGPGEGLLVFDAQGQTRVFEVRPGSKVSLSGLTITGGNADDEGGGIQNHGNLILSRVSLMNNFARHGGAIGNFGILTIIGSILSENSVRTYGGAIYNDGIVTITNSTLSRNSALGGGGVDNEGILTIAGSSVSGNSAHQKGGGVFNFGVLTVANSTVVENSALDRGGGLYNFLGSTIVITNSTVSGNSASLGGGVCNYPDEKLTLLNSIVALNTATHSDHSDPDVDGSITPESAFNLIGGDPKFVRNPSPGGDGARGTSDDDYGDLRLRSDSPAINAGSNALLPADSQDLDGDGDTAEALPIDLAGNPRVIYTTVDIGAYEYWVQGDLNEDYRVGAADLDIVRANWGRSVTPRDWRHGDVTGDGVVGAADFDLVRANWGKYAPPVPPAPNIVQSVIAQPAIPVATTASQLSSDQKVVGPPKPTICVARAHDAVLAESGQRQDMVHWSALAEVAWWHDLQQLHAKRQSDHMSVNEAADALLACAMCWDVNR